MKAGLTCREFIEFLDDYLSETQAAEVRADFESHLSVCPYCVDYLRTYEDAIKLGKCVHCDDEHPDQLPPDVPEELVQAILTARAKGATSRVDGPRAE